MTAPLPRFTCSVTARDGTPCARSEPHGTEDIHANAGRSWGYRTPTPEWRRRVLEGLTDLTRDLTGKVAL